MNPLILDKIKDQTSSLKYIDETIEGYFRLAPAFENVDLSDCSSMDAYRYDKHYSVTFTLREDKRDSRLPHVIAQEFGVNLNKTQSWDKKSLTYRTETDIPLNDGVDGYKMSISINGSVPPTCHLEYTEEAIPEDQLVRTRRIAKIVCDDSPSAPEEETVTVGAEG